ncbi:MAG: DapH/DapD/GlmU-related protein [Candidatus Woesearchaeota archaeon]
MEGKNIILGSNVQIGDNVVIHDDTIIGDNVRIDDNTVLGKRPMKSVNSAVTKEKELDPLVIGDGVLIGANSVIYRGAKINDDVLVADLASIREDVSIGEKTIIGRGASIENECSIGKKCKIETNAYITAYSKLEDYVFIGPCVSTSNDNYVGRTKERFKHFKGVEVRKGARIGLNSTILPGIVINEDALVAAGSTVTKDIPKKEIWMGSPAKYFKDVSYEQLLINQEFYEE